MDQYIRIGTIGKAQGVDGFVRLKVEERYLGDLLQTDVIFIELKGYQTPYFIEGFDANADLLLKVEDIDSKEDAREISGKPCFLRKQDIKSPVATNTAELAERYELLVGYQIIDEAAGEVGIIEEVVEYPQQFLALIRKEGEELLIPLNDTFIQDIDGEQQLVRMDLPEGLV